MTLPRKKSPLAPQAPKLSDLVTPLPWSLVWAAHCSQLPQSCLSLPILEKPHLWLCYGIQIYSLASRASSKEASVIQAPTNTAIVRLLYSFPLIPGP